MTILTRRLEAASAFVRDNPVTARAHGLDTLLEELNATRARLYAVEGDRDAALKATFAQIQRAEAAEARLAVIDAMRDRIVAAIDHDENNAGTPYTASQDYLEDLLPHLPAAVRGTEGAGS